MEGYQDKKESEEVLQILGFENAADFRAYLRELLGVVEVSEELMKTTAQGLLANPAKLKNYPFEITEKELKEMGN